MKHFTLLACGIAILSGQLAAEDRPGAAELGPPRFVVVTRIDRNAATITYRDRVSDLRGLTELSEKLRRGKQPDEDALLKFLSQDLTVFRDVTFDLSKGQMYTAGGIELTPEQVLRQLSRGSVAVVSASGKNLDPAYRQLLQREAIVLVPPLVSDLPPLPPPPKKK
jgi:hypothetical protein